MQKTYSREELKLEPIFFEDYINEAQPSTYYDKDDIEVLIIRNLGLFEGALKFSSLGFLIKDNQVYKYFRDQDRFQALEKNYRGLYRELIQTYKKNEKILNSYIDMLDSLEEDLYERDNLGSIMDRWFKIKRDLSKVDRYFERIIVALKNFTKVNADNDNMSKAHFNDILDDLVYQSSRTKGHLHRMESIHNYYALVKTDKLNKDIYILTIVSAIFLPLNLMVGFFGMNTENLFFKENPMGTTYVIYLLGGILLLTIFGLKILQILDRLILKRFFRRYDFYGELQKKIKALSSKS